MTPVYLLRVCLWAPSRPDDKRSFPAVSETGTLASVASALGAFPCFLEISTTNCRCNPTPAWSCFCRRCPRLQFWESYINISMHFMYKYLLLSFTNVPLQSKYYPCLFFENQMLLPKCIMFARLEVFFPLKTIFYDLNSRRLPLLIHTSSFKDCLNISFSHACYNVYL